MMNEKNVTRFVAALILLLGGSTGALAAGVGATARPAFVLGASVKQVSAACPHALVTAYDNIRLDTHFVCDDGTKSTVVIFEDDRLVAIIDVKYFAKQPGN